MTENTANGCPVTSQLNQPVEGGSSQDWWPNRLNLKVLQANPPAANPFGPDYNYRDEVARLDVDALAADIDRVMTTSQPWWPADWGHYGPLFIRMAWHAAGTYRVNDGRGGAGSAMQRFAPLNSWPDNVSLDKARRLLWPVKQKYGRSLSWADLFVFTGNRALESMGLKTVGFAFGREDGWEPAEDVYWGPEHTWLGTELRYSGERDLEAPLAATTMGLIYVNPQGPEGVPDPVAAAIDIRETFGRMAMNDVETAALIVGGHTFGKTHGAHPDDKLGPEPEAAPMEQMGLGWRNGYGTGVGPDTVTSGIEVIWTHTPTKWDNSFLEILYGNEWELDKSAAGAHQWKPRDGGWGNSVPEPFDTGKTHPGMLTTDLSLRMDPIYGEITRRWLDHPQELADEFAKAWFKLIHRDMGPVSRYLGPLVPQQTWDWQDIIPPSTTKLTAEDIADLKKRILTSGLTVRQLVSTAWAASSSFRSSDKRGGANGARIRLQPQIGWEVNEPDELRNVIRQLEDLQDAFNGNGRAVSFADLVVLAGAAAVEKAAADAGVEVQVPFVAGRGDATQEQTDIESVEYLEPIADAFRNYLGKAAPLSAEYMLVDKANLLGLSTPEMTVLLGGLRVLGANYRDSAHGVFTDRPGVLTNDFFTTVVDMGIEWTPVASEEGIFEGRDRATGELKWTGTRADLVFGSNAELRAVAEVYAADDAQEKFVRDFVAAWVKVSDADRFDLQ